MQGELRQHLLGEIKTATGEHWQEVIDIPAIHPDMSKLIHIVLVNSTHAQTSEGEHVELDQLDTDTLIQVTDDLII